MKNCTVIGFLVLFLLNQSFSLEIRKDFITTHSIYTILHIIDYRQTLNVTKEGYSELNFILGEKPSKEQIDLYFIGMYLVNTSVSLFLYNKNKRAWNLFMGFILGIKSTAVYYNFTVLKRF